jgi:uncharacterized YigZ family protein
MPTQKSVAGPFRLEIDKVKGSRFIASVAPVTSALAAQDFLAARRAEFRDASHNCSAWVLAEGSERKKSSDDGEPSGTAGRPILQEIESRGLTNLIVVVTRYFGGVKLGKGGLVRAYALAASSALDAAPKITTRLVATLRFAHAYEATGKVQAVLAAFELVPRQVLYAEEAEVELSVPIEDIEALRRALQNASAGQARWLEALANEVE